MVRKMISESSGSFWKKKEEAKEKGINFEDLLKIEELENCVEEMESRIVECKKEIILLKRKQKQHPNGQTRKMD